MPITPLSDLVVGRHDWTVQVYVSRLWNHRGGTDDGPIKHTDIVFQDAQGTHMYGEISQNLVSQFADLIQEGRVYELSRFLVGTEKSHYKPVDGEFIIRFGRYTACQYLEDAPLMDYPLCTYNLTPIDNLPRQTDVPTHFTDVIGVITGVSPLSQFHSSSRTTPSIKRVVYLSDLSGCQISLVLWGERAAAFEGDAVLTAAAQGPQVAIFVGTLIKSFENKKCLSGGAPCRWYINEDLPEINQLQAQLKGKLPAIQGIKLPSQTPAEINAEINLETKTVKELVQLDIWMNKKTRFYCNVVVTKLSPGQRWWFHGCTTCGKGTIPFGSAYKCPDKDCEGTGGAPRYRICYIVSDGTDEVEVVFFDRTGKELMGKAALTLLRSKAPQGLTVDEAIQFGRTDQSTPREIASIISKKFRLVVSVSSKSFEANVDKTSYQVHRIDTEFGKQPHSSAIRRKPGLALASSSGSSGTGLSTLGEALVHDLIHGQTNSSAASGELSPTFTPSENIGSVLGSEIVVADTPESVVKPPMQPYGKQVTDSGVKRALQFEDSPPRVESGTFAASGSEIESEQLDAAPNEGLTPPPNLPNATSPVIKRKTQGRNQANTNPKKNKP